MESSQKTATIGATPSGTSDEASAARAVREMFTSIAPRYDLLNHVLSLNVDRIWWNRIAKRFKTILSRPNARVLDLCCGTGDMTLALDRQGRRTDTQIVGADFSHAMLQRAASKSTSSNLRWIEGDALELPFCDSCFDLATSAFGFRNLANYDAGLRETVRILKPDGECGILDFAEPNGAIGTIYRIYFRHILPRIGSLISGVRGPYSYLPASVERFPGQEEMLLRMKKAGFREVSWTPYTFGIAGLYWGKK
jgi:demethylmenaquinone methyltransferase / 2-methoxy-6-polyprenyl-1,4-benzoquinol methylase